MLADGVGGAASQAASDSNSNSSNILLGNKRAAAITIAVFCVDARYRGRGVASALVQRCDHIVTAVWGNGVATTATMARRASTLKWDVRMTRLWHFSQVQGSKYDHQEGLIVMLPVRRRNKVQLIPHLQLVKTLDPAK
jgi:GNAT superfamily N-acetyltransferase